MLPNHILLSQEDEVAHADCNSPPSKSGYTAPVFDFQVVVNNDMLAQIKPKGWTGNIQEIIQALSASNQKTEKYLL